MASIEELRVARLQKLRLLQEAGMDPYPSITARDYPLDVIREEFGALAAEGRAHSIAGRVMAIQKRLNGRKRFFAFC